MNNIIDEYKNIYLNILNEEVNPFGVEYIHKDDYKEIHIYFSVKHLNLRVKQRNDKSANLLYLIQNFIKTILKEDPAIFLKFEKYNDKRIPFAVKFLISKIFLAGEFKQVNGIWYCKVATNLPFDGHHFSKDFYREIEI